MKGEDQNFSTRASQATQPFFYTTPPLPQGESVLLLELLVYFGVFFVVCFPNLGLLPKRGAYLLHTHQSMSGPTRLRREAGRSSENPVEEGEEEL